MADNITNNREVALGTDIRLRATESGTRLRRTVIRVTGGRAIEFTEMGMNSAADSSNI